MSKGSNSKCIQRGGAIRMPAEYFGQDSGRYFADGAPELATPSCQRPASFGTIFPDGTVGPILRTQTGGRRGRHRHPHKHNSKSKKNTKSKSRKLSLKMMSKKLERMSKRLSQKVKNMRTNVTMSL